MTSLIQIIVAFCGSLGFAVLYNIRGKKLALAALGGLLAWSLFLFLGLFIDSEPIRYLIVSMTVSLYAEILARALKTTATTFIIEPLIPLVPGGSLYYTMSSAFSGDLNLFIGNAVHTLSLALSIAIGVVVVAAATHFIMRLRTLKKNV